MPRTPRLLAPWEGLPGAGPAQYHCTSRVVDKQRVLGIPEKEKFLEWMRLYAKFCGVQILTRCIMDNHFHLLIEVPPRPAGGLSDDELCERLLLIKSEREVDKIRDSLKCFRAKDDLEAAEQLRESHLYRMWSLSEFMKSLKQRFSRWFNQRHDRRGTLWEERFKSVLVESGNAARFMAAYIDLNPIRAAIKIRPEDYRWCGYAAAVAGCQEARAGITRLMENYEQLGGGEPESEQQSWESVSRKYRILLYHDGEERLREDAVTGKVEVIRPGFSRQEVEKVLEAGGELNPGQTLRCRLRAATEGAVFGTKQFLEEVFEAMPAFFGPTRQSGAKQIRGCVTQFFCARGLRKNAVTLPELDR